MAGTNNSWNNQIAGSYNQIILNAGTNGVAISTDASAATVNVATGGAVKTTTLGSTNSTSATTVQSGSGALNVTATGGALTINSGTGALAISNDASATTVTIGTGAAAKTITLGSTNTTSTTNLQSGSGGIKIPAFAEGALVTSSSGVISTVTGTAGFILTANAAGTAPSFQAAASSGAMVLIQTQNPSGSSGITFTSGITSTYNNYVIIVSSYTTSSSGNLLLQFSSNGGASYINTGYTSSAMRWPNNATTVTTVVNSTTSIILTEANTGFFNGGTFNLWNVTSGTGYPSTSGFSTWSNGSAGGTLLDQTFGAYLTQTAMNAFQLIPGSGTFTGTISLYGIAK